MLTCWKSTCVFQHDIFRHFNICPNCWNVEMWETPWCFNMSTFVIPTCKHFPHVNSSTVQHFSMFSMTTRSTLQHSNVSTSQPFQHLNIPTFQHSSIPTLLPCSICRSSTVPPCQYLAAVKVPWLYGVRSSLMGPSAQLSFWTGWTSAFQFQRPENWKHSAFNAKAAEERAFCS